MTELAPEETRVIDDVVGFDSVAVTDDSDDDSDDD
jgi:hypothetical protein